MGFFGRLLGIENETSRGVPARPPRDADSQAIERYRYMVRTAPPETLEQAYAEAFAKLTPEQRERVRAELSQNAPEAERAAIGAAPAADTQALARAATRAEVRQPGSVERSLGSGALGFGANLLSSFAMGFVGSMVAQSFFSAIGGFGVDDAALADADADADADATEANAGADAGADADADMQADLDDGGDFDAGGDFEV